MSDLGAEVDSSWDACTVAGRRLRAAAMERRGETARRAMADMICWRWAWRWRRWHSQDRSGRLEASCFKMEVTKWPPPPARHCCTKHVNSTLCGFD